MAFVQMLSELRHAVVFTHMAASDIALSSVKMTAGIARGCGSFVVVKISREVLRLSSICTVGVLASDIAAAPVEATDEIEVDVVVADCAAAQAIISLVKSVAIEKFDAAGTRRATATEAWIATDAPGS